MPEQSIYERLADLEAKLAATVEELGSAVYEAIEQETLKRVAREAGIDFTVPATEVIEQLGAALQRERDVNRELRRFQKAALSRADVTPIGVPNGAEMIATERRRQVEVLGYDDDHDSGQSYDALLRAARCYLTSAEATWFGRECVTFDGFRPGDGAPSDWPWRDEEWKPSGTAVRDLVRAGALIAAEIDRILRRTDEAATDA